LGDFYQVSNEVTLGIPETEILSRVKVTADYLLAEERRERERLLQYEKKRLLEIAGKSIAAAKRCYQVTSQDALSILSPLRLASALGLLKGRDLRYFNELLIQMGAGRPHEIKRDRFSENGENMRRASVLKHGMNNLEINANYAFILYVVKSSNWN
jgi:protein arginine kinase